MRLAPILSAHGVDLIDASSGGNDPRQKIKPGNGYQVPFASAMKKSLPPSSPLLISAVGGLFSGVLAQKVLDDGDADAIFVGRMFQKNPGQVQAMADELGVEVHNSRQIGWGFKGRAVKALGGSYKDAGAAAKDSKL